MVLVTDHDDLDLPEELRRVHEADEYAPRRPLGVRVAVIVVVLAMILTTVAVWVVQAGLIFPM